MKDKTAIDEDWVSEVCITLRGNRSQVELAQDRVTRAAHALKSAMPGLRVSEHCDSSGPESDYTQTEKAWP